MPTDAELESSLRQVIRDHNKSGSSDAISVNLVRQRAQEKLGLEEDFFKGGVWKQKSKDIIHDEFDSPNDPEHPSVAKKRQSTSPVPHPRPSKKSKLNLQDDQDDSTALSDPPDSEMDSPKPKSKKPVNKSIKVAPKAKAKAKAVESDEELSDAHSEESKDMAIPPKDDDSSSELSSVLDEPVPKKKRSQSAETKTKSKPAAKSKSAAESDPNTEEIKKLQGWLVKCGVRKVWGKELKPYETSKAKINHLKSMLADVGMTGRFSNEKAAAIKEQRELQADIEAVQEGNERWGKDAGDEDSDDRRPKKRLVRGAQNYAFLSSDGEETD